MTSWKPTRMFPIHPLLILADQNNKKGYDPPNEVAVHLLPKQHKSTVTKSVQSCRLFFSTRDKQSHMPSKQYLEELLTQGAVNICPKCFKAGNREKFCTNAVVIQPENLLVCCYLGDKHELTAQEFRKKVADLKKEKA